MKINNEHAVSPVVGIMLMLVVTVIIAAVVSGFAGGMMKGQSKAPQATIQGKFSTSQGMQIIHAGGEAIPTSGMVITVKNGPTFGPNLEAMSTNILNLRYVTNSNSTPIAYYNPATSSIDGYNVTAFKAGDVWYVNLTNCDPRILQPTVAAFGTAYTIVGDHWTFIGPEKKRPYWTLNFVNTDNIGKSFYLDVNDKASGALISRAVVTISG
jgi:archaeal type IV pilus assembly protein PilA